MRLKGLIRLSTLMVCAVVSISISASATPQFDRDVPDTVKQGLLTDLEFVGAVKGTSTGLYYKQIFGENSLSGLTLTKFFDERVVSVGLDECGGPPAAACVKPNEPTKMWLTNMYINNNIPQMLRMSVLFHESRHTEVKNNNWHHAICPTPYLDANGKDIVGIISGVKMEGKPACDVVAFGSYGLQAVLLKSLQTSCASCNEKLVLDAKLYGNDTLNRISDLKTRNSMIDDLK